MVIKASTLADDAESCAVIIEGRAGIYKVSHEVLSVLGITQADFYNQFVFLEDLEDFKNISISGSSFDIAYNISKNTTEVTLSGKKVDDTNFRSYFNYFTYMKPAMGDNLTSGATELTAVFTFRETSKGKITINYARHDDRRYLVTINGEKMGLITAASFENIKKYLTNVINGDIIPEVM